MEKNSFQVVYSSRATVFEWKKGCVTNFAQCAAKCVKTPGCKAIELWHKYNRNCYWCKRTDLIRPYTNKRDLAYPAHVWVQSKHYRLLSKPTNISLELFFFFNET